MSAIDTTFHFVRNPTAINGLATTYVSKRGSDTTGDGTAQNPYASIAKATAMATANTNIMLDDGEWNEARTTNNRTFHWWGNGYSSTGQLMKNFWQSGGDYFHYFTINNFSIIGVAGYASSFNSYQVKFFNCVVKKLTISSYRCWSGKDTIFLCTEQPNYYGYYENCIFLYRQQGGIFAYNCIINGATGTSIFGDFNNFCGNTIPTNNNSNAHSINDATTGQTFADYFNKYDANDWLQCDFTAKEGSKNIGAGEKGSTIGLNEGFTMYADNSANDVFKESNGATLKNIAWDSNLNGYTLVQKERVCVGATANTITLDSNASLVDDYYNNLFVGIVAGDGQGEIFKITDYDGATKTATIDGSWNTTPNTNSIYTISGTILSAIKDFGKAIKVKRNWTFADNFTALTDGQWAEFMTHVEANGKQFPVSCYSYEYSTDGVNFVQGQTADDLVSATNGENKVTDNIYGDCSTNYDEETAKNLIMRYIRVRVHIGFNIGQIGE